MHEWLLVVVICINVWTDFLDRDAAARSDAAALGLWTTICQLLLVAPLLGLAGALTLQQILICAAIGTFSALARVSWYRALSTPGERLSRLAPFTRLSSVIVLFFAFTLLGESFSQEKLIGALLMIAGAVAMSLDWTGLRFRDYILSKKAVFLVLVFSVSIAAVTVYYKFMLNAGVSVLTTYFFLKLFQCLGAVTNAVRTKALHQSFSAITDLRLFVQARALQTLAAFLYLFVLRNVDLSTVEPIAVALSPILYFAIDKYSELRRLPMSEIVIDPVSEPQARRSWITGFLGFLVMAAGLFLMSQDR